MSSSPNYHWYTIAAISFLLLVSGVYYYGLQGPFLFDDNANILRVPAIALRDLSFSQLRDAVFSTGTEFPDRGLARLSFGLNYYFSGGEFNVLAFKLTNLSIHFLNAMVFWFIAQRVLVRFAALGELDGVIAGRPWWQWAALLSALIWALHPLQLTAVLYIVQRMTSLSALFCLLGLAGWICGRERLEAGSGGALPLMVGSVCAGMGLGMLSKENAILLPFYALIIELIFFRRDTLKPSALRMIRGFFLLFALIPALLAVGVIAGNWDYIAADYQGRSFTLMERLLTESRILWYYLQLLFYPDAHSFGIYHDDFTLSRDLLTPVTTLMSLIGWISVFVAAVAGIIKQRLFSFAVLWYLIGHSIESSFIGLELIFEHRNYLPVAGVILAFSVYLIRALMALSEKPVIQLTIPCLFVLVLSFVTFTRANIWQYQYTMVVIGVKNHPNSARFHREYATVLSENEDNEALVFKHLQTAVRLTPGDVAGLFEMSRIINRRIINRRLINAGASNDQPAGADRNVDVFVDPVPVEVPQLLAYDVGIDRELQRRAREEVLITNSAEMGRYSQTCLNTGNLLCEQMQDRVAVWTKAVSENPYLFPAGRALSALAYAKLIVRQDPQAAFDSLEHAIRLIPGSVTFRIEKATLYLALNQFDEADKALDEIRDLLHWSGYSRGAYELVRRRVREARQNSTGLVTGTGTTD